MNTYMEEPTDYLTDRTDPDRYLKEDINGIPDETQEDKYRTDAYLEFRRKFNERFGKV